MSSLPSLCWLDREGGELSRTHIELVRNSQFWTQPNRIDPRRVVESARRAAMQALRGALRIRRRLRRSVPQSGEAVQSQHADAERSSNNTLDLGGGKSI